HQTRRSAARLSHLRRSTEVDLDALRVARFGVPRRQRCRALDHRTRKLDALRIFDDHVTPRGSASDMKPNVVWIGDAKREVIIFGITAPNQDLEPFHDDGSIRTSFARHRDAKV